MSLQTLIDTDRLKTFAQYTIVPLRGAVGNLSDSFAETYDNTATYAVGDWCIYDNKLYRCNTAAAAGNFNSANWTAVAVTDAIGGYCYGSCTSAKATVNKAVTISKGSFKLATGAVIAVKFTNASVANARLNVNGTGNVAIMKYGTTPVDAESWEAGSVCMFAYDGTNWIMCSGSGASGGTTIVQIPTVTVGEYTYNGNEQGPQIGTYDPSQVIVTNATNTDAGTYTLTLSLANTSKMVWTDLTTADKTYEYTIDKADISGVTVNISGYTYAGTKSTPSVSSNPSGGTVTYYGRSTASGAATAWDSVTSTTYDAGTRYCYAVIAETDNYNSFTTANASFTIAKATIEAGSITVNISDYTYGGTKSTPSLSAANPSGGTVTYKGRATTTGTGTAWDSVTSTTYDAGTRYIYCEIASTTNYNAYTSPNTSFTIAKAAGSVSTVPSFSQKTYTGSAQAVATAGAGTGTMYYYLSTSSSTPATSNYSTSLPTLTNASASTYYLWYYSASATNYNATAATYITWSGSSSNMLMKKAAGSLSLSPTSVTLNSSNLTASVTATRSHTSTMTYQSSDTSVATATISGATITVNNVNQATGTATITVTLPADDNHTSATATISVTAQFTTIYGVSWSGTSSSAWSRTDASASFTDPVPAVGNGNGSSPFDSCMPWSGMERVTDSSAGVLVKIPKFYYKWTISGSTMKLQIADGAADGFSVSPAHADRGDGSGERDYVYVGAYHCSTSDYKSTTGVKPKASITRATARTNIHNLGTGIWQWDYAMLVTIWMLYLVEYADWNSQAKIGYGCGNDSATENAGLCDAMTYHTGTNASSRTTYGHTRYRYIEDLWGNVLDWCDGIYFSSANVYAIKNPANFSDSSGGTNVGTRPTSSNCIKAWSKSSASGFDWFIYPSEVVSDSNYSTYSCDYCSYGSSGVVLYVGGGYYQGQYYGLFFLYGYNAASNTSSSIGSRLQKLP